MELANEIPLFACVTAIDDLGNESECSDMVSVMPSAARWVHASGGPSGSYTSISEALFGAPNGTRVIVGPGIYEEASIIVGADDSSGWNPLDIWLMSERGPAETKIITGQIEVGDKCRVIGFTLAEAPGRVLNIVFDRGVLVANNIFLGNETAIFSGGCEGWPTTTETVNRIYNNVFAGNVIGIDLWMNYQITDIQNNLFETTSGNQASIAEEFCAYTYIRYNNFHGSGSSFPMVRAPAPVL